jgi:hypothetical protein
MSCLAMSCLTHIPSAYMPVKLRLHSQTLRLIPPVARRTPATLALKTIDRQTVGVSMNISILRLKTCKFIIHLRESVISSQYGIKRIRNIRSCGAPKRMPRKHLSFESQAAAQHRRFLLTLGMSVL